MEFSAIEPFCEDKSGKQQLRILTASKEENITTALCLFISDRTVLLSTHHLDEAEIIGDRILIIHKVIH